MRYREKRETTTSPICLSPIGHTLRKNITLVVAAQLRKETARGSLTETVSGF